MKVEMLVFLLLPFLITFHSVSPMHPHVNYESIFNFGNSLSDTGNYLTIGAPGLPVIGHLPYGETFFKHATGRCSDGRLTVDFIGIFSSFFCTNNTYISMLKSRVCNFIVTWPNRILMNGNVIYPSTRVTDNSSWGKSYYTTAISTSSDQTKFLSLEEGKATASLQYQWVLV